MFYFQCYSNEQTLNEQLYKRFVVTRVYDNRTTIELFIQTRLQAAAAQDSWNELFLQKSAKSLTEQVTVKPAAC